MKRGLTQQNLKKFDKADMLDLLLDFPLQCSLAMEIAEKSRILFEKRDFKNVVFSGLGGSAVGSDLAKSYLYSESKIPLNVFREYTLPAYVDGSSLVFVSSYSGNTEETLSAYREAKERGSTLIAISSGGALKDYALKENITFINIPEGLPPRCALGYLSIIPLCIFSRLGLAKDVKAALGRMIKVLEGLRDNNLNPLVGPKDNIAKYIASKLFNKIAVIYTASVNFDVCAVRLRGQIAENSKALAWSHVFPEMNHNEIVGWQNPEKLFKSLVVLMLRDKFMHPRVVKRIEVTTDILKKEGADILEIWSSGEDLLSRIFSLIYTGDFISYYLAVLYGIDPTPVEKVSYLKKELAKVE